MSSDILLPYIPTLCRITYFYIMDTSMGWNMDLRPAQELVMLLRRDHFILSLAVSKPMTSCHVVVHSTDSPTSAIVQLETSVSQYTEYTEIWGQYITVYYHINMLYSVCTILLILSPAMASHMIITWRLECIK